MNGPRPSLQAVPSTVLSEIRFAISSGRLHAPVDHASLVGLGIRHHIKSVEHALAGHSDAACVAILDVALAERGDRPPLPELVWTGPESSTSDTRDTAIVLRSLFEGAQYSVILAGYRFDHAQEVLAPLYRSMTERDVIVRIFVDIPQIEGNTDPRFHTERFFKTFLATNWPFGNPQPRFFFDKRALIPGPPYHSMHAKCVVVDSKRAFVSSANFTQRGQEHNIEVGVLVEELNFAYSLGAQWIRLVNSGLMHEYGAE
jgi:hypothetical protein